MIANKLKQMWHDEGAVSPVIGVILMVAVTVVLAAVIGAFVFGLGDSLGDPAPNAQIAFDYDADNDEVEIIHDGGNSITTDNTGVLALGGDTVAGDVEEPEWGANIDGSGGADATEGTVTGSVGAGDTIYDSSSNTAGGEFTSGYQIDLIWNSPDGGTSQVIGSWEAP